MSGGLIKMHNCILTKSSSSFAYFQSLIEKKHKNHDLITVPKCHEDNTTASLDYNVIKCINASQPHWTGRHVEQLI